MKKLGTATVNLIGSTLLLAILLAVILLGAMLTVAQPMLQTENRWFGT